MIRRLTRRSLGLVAGLALLPAACDYSVDPPLPPQSVRNPVLPTPRLSPSTTAVGARGTPRVARDSPEAKEKREAILTNVLRLIVTAGTSPGGRNFEIATDNLNQYFEEGTDPRDFAISPAARQYLGTMLDPAGLKSFEATAFTSRDARHLEDCMLYQEIASRVAGEGDDLSRVRRVFDWLVRQVQLVPAQSLASASLQQAQARPFDVLLRGMATESQGYWSERGWLFMALCRQLGIDVGILTFTRAAAPPLLSATPDAPAGPETFAWITAALIDGKAYLFDARIGLPIPDSRGDGVATLDQAIADPQILARLDLPGQSTYGVTRSDLINSATKVGVMLDSSSGYHSPRMRLLQSRLTGKDRTILYRDAADQRDHFVAALGPHAGPVTLWEIPLRVENLLFSNPEFMNSTQQSLALFTGNLPLLYARTAQLKGQTSEAIGQYVAFRFATNGLMRDKKTPILPQVQKALDIYSTYFLAQCHLDQGNAKQAEFFFGETLRLLPLPGGGRPSFFMFRWGAETNLGLLSESKGEASRAIAFFSQFQPTDQGHGNLLRARDLLWRDPTDGPADRLPPAPSFEGAPPSAAASR